MPSRRSYLAALAAGLPVAGCTGDGRSGPSPETTDPAESTTTRSPTATDAGPLELGDAHETPAGWTLTVENAAVRKAIIQFGTVHPDPLYADGQFVVADAAVAGENAPDPAELDLFARTDTVEATPRRYVDAESNADGRRQRFGFPLPVSPAPSEGAVVYRPDTGSPIRWRLPGDLLEAVGRPPAFELHGFTARDVAGEDIEVEVTVANTGERGGTFLAEVGDAELSDQPEIAVDVPAGETVTATRRVWAAFQDRPELTVVLRWDDQRRERTITNG